MPNLASRQTLLVLAAGVAIMIVGIPQAEKLTANRDLLKPYDFVQYYSAGRVLLDGGNPYDPEQLIPLQRSMYDGVRKAIMMWNPPWTLPLTVPFAMLPWRLAQFLWLGLQLGAVLLSADMLWRIYGGAERWRWVAWLTALTFAPTLFVLLMGQISALPLLGLTGFLFFIRRHQPIVAGCFAALTAIKPHLLPLFALTFLLEATQRHWTRKALLAGAGCLALCALLPLFWNAQVWAQYVATMGRPPSETFETMREFEHPTMGYWLRQQSPGRPFVVQFIPALLAVASALILWWRHRSAWSWDAGMPWLVLVSILTAGYGAWAFDLVVLLLPIISIAVWLAESRRPLLSAAISIGYLFVNVLVLLTIRDAGSQANPWIAPVVFAAYTVAWLTRRAWRRPVT